MTWTIVVITMNVAAILMNVWTFIHIRRLKK